MCCCIDDFFTLKLLVLLFHLFVFNKLQNQNLKLEIKRKIICVINNFVWKKINSTVLFPVLPKNTITTFLKVSNLNHQKTTYKYFAVHRIEGV